jgi:AcrR family transcriptional regulator
MTGCWKTGTKKQLSLRERNKQKVTQRIIVAAVEMFKTRGYTQTTMDDIAAQAEISRKTLFNYFSTKESLLLPWGQEIFDQHVQPAFETYFKTQPTTIQALHFLFTNMGEIIQTFPDAIQAFVHEASKPHNKAQNRHIGVGFQEFFIQILHRGQNRGEVRTDIPLESIARYLMALQMSLLFNLLDPLAQIDFALEVDRLLTLVEAGLTPI